VGTALLLHSFRAFQQRGLNIVGLGVDSDSPTNALVLYERAGMRPFFERHVYRKVLHAGSGG
jgi:ribosomal protein S18 acetylase RimI-like enzyme